MIFVTGDTHGKVQNGKDSNKLFDPSALPKAFLSSSKENYLIITGDFGCVWSEDSLADMISYFSKFNGTILFCDGNNDNNDLLNTMPVSYWNGGKIHRIEDNIIHLMRGEIYEIEGKKILSLGGADSWDRYLHDRRKEGVNWWASETINKSELDNALNNLKRHNNTVDFVISHDCTSSGVLAHFPWNIPSPVNHACDKVDAVANYRHWFFGHHHRDTYITPNMSCIYNRFESLDHQKFSEFRNNTLNQNSDFDM